MVWRYGMTLEEFGTEMTALSTRLSKADGMTEAERRKLYQEAEDLCSELENEYGVPAFRPEVPEATQKAFFALLEAI